MIKKPLIYAIPLVLAAGLVSFWAVRSADSDTDPAAVSDVGLTDEERTSLRATVVARSGEERITDAIDFAKSGEAADVLPRAEIESFAGLLTTDPRQAANDAAVVVLVQSDGGYVDQTTGRLHLRLRTVERIKGDVGETFDIALAGGPRKQADGGWVLAVAPYELYLAKGETAILLLTDQSSSDGTLRQRPFEAMAIIDGKVVDRDTFPFTSLVNVPVDEVRQQLSTASE